MRLHSRRRRWWWGYIAPPSFRCWSTSRGAGQPMFSLFKPLRLFFSPFFFLFSFRCTFPPHTLGRRLSKSERGGNRRNTRDGNRRERLLAAG